VCATTFIMSSIYYHKRLYVPVMERACLSTKYEALKEADDIDDKIKLGNHHQIVGLHSYQSSINSNWILRKLPQAKCIPIYLQSMKKKTRNHIWIPIKSLIATANFI
jgi:hypothetical protein